MVLLSVLQSDSPVFVFHPSDIMESDQPINKTNKPIKQHTYIHTYIHRPCGPRLGLALGLFS